ncbi:MAG: hypothetical protein KAT61_09405, partial [Gammaproteobacteria bacterium]|nr:hypothetical protein [Gammaproteobacteria bacterium]
MLSISTLSKFFVSLNYILNITAVPLTFSKLSTTIDLFGKDYIYTIRGMKWKPLPETRCKYVHVRSDAA